MKKKDHKSPHNFFPLNRYILTDSMKSVVANYKKNEYEKDVIGVYSNFKARSLLNKIKFVEQFDDILPKPINIFENLYNFAGRLTDSEKVLFILAKLELNGLTSYPRLIREHLSTLKSNHNANNSSEKNKYINNLLKDLEDANKITRIHECPNCRQYYSSQNKKRFPDYCKCGHKFFLQPTSFKKLSNRPYCLVELTGNGWDFLNESIKSLLKASHFCMSWLEFLTDNQT